MQTRWFNSFAIADEKRISSKICLLFLSFILSIQRKSCVSDAKLQALQSLEVLYIRDSPSNIAGLETNSSFVAKIFRHVGQTDFAAIALDINNGTSVQKRRGLIAINKGDFHAGLIIKLILGNGLDNPQASFIVARQLQSCQCQNQNIQRP